MIKKIINKFGYYTRSQIVEMYFIKEEIREAINDSIETDYIYIGEDEHPRYPIRQMKSYLKISYRS